MSNFLNSYYKLPYEEKMLYTTRVSLLMNLVLAIGKIIFGVFYGVVFIIAGSFNAFMFLAKLECLLGIKNNKRTFKERNTLISIFLFIASLVYVIYMSRLIFFDVKVFDYTMFIGINIAFVSFVELGIAIYGLFRVKKSGHYYRNIKIINLCSALTAIVLTQIAILTFTKTENVNVTNGLTGVGVGVVAMLLSIYIYFAPKVSIIDREYNEYQLENASKNKLLDTSQKEGEIILKKSKIYGDYVYKYYFQDGTIKGDVIKKKGCFSSLNIIVKIILIILSEILIFPYCLGRLIYFFRTTTIIETLDALMQENGLVKINQVSTY